MANQNKKEHKKFMDLRLVDLDKKKDNTMRVRFCDDNKRWYIGDSPVSEAQMNNLRDFLNKSYAIGWLNDPEKL